MELSRIVLRVAFGYAFVLLLLRLTGKRSIARSTSFDVVLALILGDLLDDLFWAEVPPVQFAVAAGTLVMIQLSVAIGCRTSQQLARVVEGEPSTLIANGVLNPAMMRRERLSRNDVTSLVRRAASLDSGRWTEIERARLEADGEMSVIRHDWARPAQQVDRKYLTAPPVNSTDT